MFTTGSKFLIGSAVIATVTAIAYGVTQDGVMGTIGLASAAIVLWFLAVLNLFIRDSNYWADEISSIDTAPAAVRAPVNTVWPFAFAFSAAVFAVGLVTYQAVFVIGVVLLLVTGAEWTAEAWAHRASADVSHNADVRDRIANPLEFPLAAAIGIGIVVYAFSRVMLWLSKTSTVVAFSVLGAIIITLAFLFAYRPKVSSKAAAVVIGVGALGLIAGGAAAGLSGERDIEQHETTEGLAEEGVDICTSPEEFEADEKASQTVAATAAVAATITLGADGELTYELNGPSAQGADGITLPRSNPNNIVFRNDSGEHRRLSASLGTEVVEEDGVEEERPFYVCTALVDDGGVQNITMSVALPSVTAEDGYFFFVPGVDTARLNLLVP
ncbi:MAG: hypothetical protein WBL31_08665 [Ilumatobacteraceae bacterium]|jgi:hypothetical protein